MSKPRIAKQAFKLLTSFVVGGAIGSILGLTLAPKKGSETREYLHDKSMDLFLKGKEQLRKDKKIGFLKRTLIKWLTPKRNRP